MLSSVSREYSLMCFFHEAWMTKLFQHLGRTWTKCCPKGLDIIWTEQRAYSEKKYYLSWTYIK